MMSLGRGALGLFGIMLLAISPALTTCESGEEVEGVDATKYIDDAIDEAEHLFAYRSYALITNTAALGDGREAIEHVNSGPDWYERREDQAGVQEVLFIGGTFYSRRNDESRWSRNRIIGIGPDDPRVPAASKVYRLSFEELRAPEVIGTETTGKRVFVRIKALLQSGPYLFEPTGRSVLARLMDATSQPAYPAIHTPPDLKTLRIEGSVEIWIEPSERRIYRIEKLIRYVANDDVMNQRAEQYSFDQFNQEVTLPDPTNHSLQ